MRGGIDNWVIVTIGRRKKHRTRVKFILLMGNGAPVQQSIHSPMRKPNRIVASANAKVFLPNHNPSQFDDVKL